MNKDHFTFLSDLTLFMETFSAATNNQLIVFTDSAMIMGNPYSPNKDADSENDEIIEVFMDKWSEIRDKKTANIPDEEIQIKGIPLTNVSIRRFGDNAVTNIPFLFVLTDKILGYSFGKID